MKKLFFFGVFTQLAFGAGGIDRVNTFLTNLQVALYAIGAIVLTLAIMWAAFKILIAK